MGVLEDRSVVVVGAGMMGNAYLPKLIEQGIDPREIGVVDFNPLKLEAIKSRHPQIATASELCEASPRLAFCVTNSPAHLSTLDSLTLYPERPAVLCEKPLFTTNQLLYDTEQVARVVRLLSHGYTAYLIDFSQAVESLLEFMNANDLSIIEGRSVWEKNRTADTRPTAGDLEDEMTHPLAVLMLLARQNQHLQGIKVSAALSHLEFVEATAQAALAQVDRSIPERPNSTTSMDIRLTTDKCDLILLSLFSSFVSPDQTREVQVVLSKGGDPHPSHGAKIIFDHPEHGDVLKIWEYPKRMPTESFFKSDKLARQIKAFLAAAEGGPRSPMLKTFADGLEMVDLAQAAFSSNFVGSSAVPVEPRRR